MRKLILTQPQIRQIERKGAAAYPNECCGVMIGRDEQTSEGVSRVVDRLAALPNSYDSSEQYHRFSVNPLDLMKVDKEAGAEGKLVLGFYHSHPDHPAKPSETDRVNAWPFYSYVIVAIAKGQAVNMTSWELNEQTETFQEEVIQS